MEFKATSSFAYHFAKKEVLPIVDDMDEVNSGLSFRLKDLTYKVTDQKLTSEQLQKQVLQSGGKTETMRSLIRFWALTIATNTKRYVPLGKGMFRKENEEDFDEVAAIDAALENEGDAEDEVADEFDGNIYAFSFPCLLKIDSDFPIKIGRTVGDVEKRVLEQCGSVGFEQPKILGYWAVNRMKPTELAIHNTLKARGKWRENVPGKEWFDTNLKEIEAILIFVTNGNLNNFLN